MQIPEGYDLLPTCSRENAKAALALAVERGVPESSVLTTQDGYLIPLGSRAAEVEDLEADTDEADTESDSPDVIESAPGSENEEPIVIEGEPITLPVASATKGDLEAFAEKHGVDLSEAKNNEDRHAAIQAWFEKLPALGSEEQKEN